MLMCLCRQKRLNMSYPGMERNGLVNSLLEQLSYRSKSCNYSNYKEFTIQPPKKTHFYKAILLSITSLSALKAFYENCFQHEMCVKGCFLPSALFTITLLIMYNILWTVKKETLLVAVPLSFQLTTTYLGGRETTMYIPWHKVKNLMIIDVITRQRVLFYLAVLISQKDSSETHVVLFENTVPRLADLEIIYREVQHLIDISR